MLLLRIHVLLVDLFGAYLYWTFLYVIVTISEILKLVRVNLEALSHHMAPGNIIAGEKIDNVFELPFMCRIEQGRFGDARFFVPTARVDCNDLAFASGVTVGLKVDGILHQIDLRR